MTRKEKKRHIPIHHYFWIFALCSFIGAFYEEVFHTIFYFFKHHEIDWSRRSGVFWGPVSPVYGCGAVFFLFLLGRKERSKTKTFIYASLLGGIAEYLMSFA